MKKKTRETIVKILLVIGVILTILCCIYSFKLGIIQDTNPRYKEFYVKTAIIFSFMVIDAIVIYILMGKEKRI